MSCQSKTWPPVVSSGSVVGTSASPGFMYGRAGDIAAGTYLEVIGMVTSNLAGNIVPFDGTITRIFVTNENNNTFDIEIQRRAGAVFTAIQTVSVVGVRKGDFDVSVAVADGDELCVKVSSGSCRNVQVGLIIEQNPT